MKELEILKLNKKVKWVEKMDKSKKIELCPMLWACGVEWPVCNDVRLGAECLECQKKVVENCGGCEYLSYIRVGDFFCRHPELPIITPTTEWPFIANDLEKPDWCPCLKKCRLEGKNEKE
jgi:hypothetical protein